MRDTIPEPNEEGPISDTPVLGEDGKWTDPSAEKDAHWAEMYAKRRAERSKSEET